MINRELCSNAGPVPELLCEPVVWVWAVCGRGRAEEVGGAGETDAASTSISSESSDRSSSLAWRLGGLG